MLCSSSVATHEACWEETETEGEIAFLFLISVIIHLSGRLDLVITNTKDFSHAQEFSVFFGRRYFPWETQK